MVRGIRSIDDTLYWMEEALKLHSKEFSTEPDSLAALNRGGIDLLARLGRLYEEVRRLDKELRCARCCLPAEYRDLFDGTNVEALSQAERDRLTDVNEKLDMVGAHIRSVIDPIEASMSEPLDDPAHRLNDYEVDIGLQFHRVESDSGYQEDGDNTVSEIELLQHNVEPDAQWPEGYDNSLPFRHGGIFHQLRLYGGYDMHPVDYRDILKIETVWVDVSVTYQYAYDLKAGKWVKRYEARGEQGPYDDVYVSEPT